MSVNLSMSHRITVDEFQRMGEEGIFAPDARLELIEGEIVEMAPVGRRHIATVYRLTTVLSRVADEGCIVSIQTQLKTLLNQPVPDLALLRPAADYYESGVPTGGDCLLVVEVSDATLLRDLNVKSGIYAQAGIPEYWVVDLRRDVVIRHTAPGNAGYGQVVECGQDAEISSSALGNREIRVAELFGVL